MTSRDTPYIRKWVWFFSEFGCHQHSSHFFELFLNIWQISINFTLISNERRIFWQKTITEYGGKISKVIIFRFWNFKNRDFGGHVIIFVRSQPVKKLLFSWAFVWYPICPMLPITWPRYYVNTFKMELAPHRG